MATGATDPSGNQNIRPTIYRRSSSPYFTLRRSYPIVDHGQGYVGGILRYPFVHLVVG